MAAFRSGVIFTVSINSVTLCGPLHSQREMTPAPASTTVQGLASLFPFVSH